MKKETKVKKVSGSSIDETIKELNKKFGADSIMMLGDNKTMKVETSPTGSFGLDIALGVGGYPKGRIIEISGPESSGKTTLALHGVVEAQKKGGICAYIDTEHALDPEYAKNIGVDIKDLVISQPAYGEQALDMVESMVRCGKFALIVVDSVASLTPKAEIDGDMEAQTIGRHAKLMSHACRKLAPVINDSKTIVIFINQIRMNIGVVFPGQSPEFTTGGKALKFYSTIRLDIRRIAQIKKGDEVVGGRTRIKVVKNKVAAPYKQTEFDIMYGEGISKQGEVLALGEKFNIINRDGQSFIFGDIKLGRGYDASRVFLKDNHKIMDEIVEKIKEAFKKPIATESELEDNKVEE